MNSISFLKRRLGNNLTQPFGLVSMIIGIGIVSQIPTILGFLLGFALILEGSIFLFGKEMTEINFAQKYIRQYFQLTFIKFGSTISLPEIKYILIRDFHTKISYSSMTEDAEYFEISLVTFNDKKIIVAFSQRKKKAKKIISEIKSAQEIRLVDNTRNKITV